MIASLVKCVSDMGVKSNLVQQNLMQPLLHIILAWAVGCIVTRERMQSMSRQF